MIIIIVLNITGGHTYKMSLTSRVEEDLENQEDYENDNNRKIKQIEDDEKKVIVKNEKVNA